MTLNTEPATSQVTSRDVVEMIAQFRNNVPGIASKIEGANIHLERDKVCIFSLDTSRGTDNFSIYHQVLGEHNALIQTEITCQQQDRQSILEFIMEQLDAASRGTTTEYTLDDFAHYYRDMCEQISCEIREEQQKTAYLLEENNQLDMRIFTAQAIRSAQLTNEEEIQRQINDIGEQVELAKQAAKNFVSKTEDFVPKSNPLKTSIAELEDRNRNLSTQIDQVKPKVQLARTEWLEVAGKGLAALKSALEWISEGRANGNKIERLFLAARGETISKFPVIHYLFSKSLLMINDPKTVILGMACIGLLGAGLGYVSHGIISFVENLFS